MDRMLLGALIALLSVACARSGRAEIYTAARLSDLRDNARFLVCTEADKRKLEGELSEEARALPRAVEAAKAEWAKALNTEAFPTTRIKPRTLKVLGTAMTREDADKLVIDAKLRDERERARAEEEEQRVLTARHAKRGGNERREVQQDREKDLVADRAEVLVRQKLAAAVGRDIPFYGAAQEAPKSGGRNKRK